jgi:hypothetical protein
MVEIHNVSQYRVGLSSSYLGAQGRPLYIGLGPTQIKQITQEELRNWGDGSKADLAGYVQHGVLKVTELTSVHLVDDLGNPLEPVTAVSLQEAYDTADTIRIAYNAHIVSLAVHGVPDLANIESLAKPTTLLLLTAFIASLQGNFNAHIALGVATHDVADAWNPVVAVTGTLAQNILALRELYARYRSHQIQSDPLGSTVLNPNQIIAY